MVPEIIFDDNEQAFMKLGDYELRLEMQELDGEFLERAQKELRESPEIKQKGIEDLRVLLENEPGLVIPNDENDFLLKFLRPCKYYPDSAFRLMKKYYKFKLNNPKLGSNLIPSVLASTVAQGITSFLPRRDKTGCRIMIAHIGNKWNPKICPLENMFRAVMMFIEIAMAEPRTQVAGAQVIFDMQGLTLNHIYQFGPKFARTLLEWVQECVPIRLKGIHVVHEPKIFNILFGIFKPFLIEKLRNRIMFHGKNFEKLVTMIGEEYLPPSYGGTMEIPETPGSLLAELLCLYEQQFQDANAIGYSKEKVIASS